MNATIISVGNELLSGLTVNSNASFIGEKLTGVGVRVIRIDTVGDVESSIVEALKRAVQDSDVIVVTGGLGPTEDDMTKRAIAFFLNVELKFHPEAYKRIERMFQKRGIPLPASNWQQAELPEGTEPVPNLVGTAPGLKFLHQNKRFYVLPGVPKEARAMTERIIVPELKEEAGSRIFLSQTFRTTGISESMLQDKLQQFSNLHPDVTVAYLPKLTGVVLRTSLFGESQSECESKLREAESFILQQTGDVIYSTQGEEMEAVVGKLLSERRQTLSVAESCTGGLIGHLLTNVPGSSDYFNRGVVAYSNAAKIELLNVPSSTIEKHGAVSAETAEAMAEGVRKLSQSNYGLSVTGIAGPGGGSEEKPVGLVYIGYSDAENTLSERHLFWKDRILNKTRSAVAALDLLRRQLLLSE